MKSLIARKFHLAILLPIFAITFVVFFYLLDTVHKNVENETRQKLQSVAQTYAQKYDGIVKGVKLTLLSTVFAIESVDPDDAFARGRCDKAIRSMFENDDIHKVWLAFDPGAFDGRDERHGEDYPGAPSGRFIRSYVDLGGKIAVEADILEDEIDNRMLYPYYNSAKETGKIYFDIIAPRVRIGSTRDSADYRYSLTIVAPVTRDGRIIGCAGADVRLDEMTLDVEGLGDAVAALFSPDCRILSATSPEFIDACLHSMNFTNLDEINRAFSEMRPLFLSNLKSDMLPGRSYGYYMPSQSGIIVFIALQIDAAYAGVRPIVVTLIVVFAAVIALTSLFAYFVTRRLLHPIDVLINTADEIASGNLNANFEVSVKNDKTIGVLSRSLHRIVEQLRVSNMAQKSLQVQFAIQSEMALLLQDANSVEDAFNSIAIMFTKRFNLLRTSIAHFTDGSAELISCYEKNYGFREPGSLARQFIQSGAEIEAMLSGKEILCLNRYLVTERGIDFLMEQTQTGYFLPLHFEPRLKGFIVLESSGDEGFIAAREEYILVHIAKTLSLWLSSKNFNANIGSNMETGVINIKASGKASGVHGELPASPFAVTPPFTGSARSENPVSAGGEPPESVGEPCDARQAEAPARRHGLDPVFAGAIEDIGEIDLEKAFKNSGGFAEVLEGLISAAPRFIATSVEKLDRYIENTDDAKPFTVEVHSLKSTLKTLGSRTLAASAEELEHSSKSGNMQFCRETYPDFREKALWLQKRLAVVLEAKNMSRARLTGLLEALPELARVTADFDPEAAIELMGRFSGVRFGEKLDAAVDAVTDSLSAFDCETALDRIEALRRGLQDEINRL